MADEKESPSLQLWNKAVVTGTSIVPLEVSLELSVCMTYYMEPTKGELVCYRLFPLDIALDQIDRLRPFRETLTLFTFRAIDNIIKNLGDEITDAAEAAFGRAAELVRSWPPTLLSKLERIFHVLHKCEHKFFTGFVSRICAIGIRCPIVSCVLCQRPDRQP